MKKLTKKQLILDKYIIDRYQQLSESEQFHEESLKRIRKEMNQLFQRKVKLMESIR